MIGKLGTALLAATLAVACSSAAFADTASNTPAAPAVNNGPLAPGAAAGVQKAGWYHDNSGWVWVGGAVVVGAILIGAGGEHDHSAATSTHP